MSRQRRFLEPSFQHVRGIGTNQRPGRQLACLSQGGREQRRAWLVAEAGRFEVFVQELFEFMVHGKLFLFAALLPEPEQKPFSGKIIVLRHAVLDQLMGKAGLLVAGAVAPVSAPVDRRHDHIARVVEMTTKASAGMRCFGAT